MKLRQIFCFLLLSFFTSKIHAFTITFKHDENVKVALHDGTYPHLLSYAPQFTYPNATIFQLQDKKFHFYSVSFNSVDYYLWIKDSSSDFELNVSELEVEDSKMLMVPKDKWTSKSVIIDDPQLKKIREIDVYYSKALNSLNQLALTNDSYNSETDFNTIVWDYRSARRLFNFSVENFAPQLNADLIYYSPAYVQYWQLMYKLYYQYFHKNAFKGLTKDEIRAKITEDFRSPESSVLIFHHFFRKGLPLSELQEHYQLFSHDLSLLEKNAAENLIQQQKVKETAFNQKIDFLFGIDIDGAMEGYFARDSSEKENVLVFWSIWDDNMNYEFNLLSYLKRQYKDDFNFVSICIDAYETPEKTKSFIYQNRVGGFHLLPDQSSAFRKSKYRKDLKIQDLPYYVVTASDGEIIQTEAMPLKMSNRLEEKLKVVSKKK